MSSRAAAFAAVSAATEAVKLVRNRAPGAEMQSAVEMASALERDLTGRPQSTSSYQKMGELRRSAERLGAEAVAAIEALSAANDAVTYLRLDGNPNKAALTAIDAARRAGVDRDKLDDVVRAARFR